MLITKSFEIQVAHRVPNCSTKKCSESIHGHSSVVEVSVWSQHLDNGAMVVDFNVLKATIGVVVNLFDHCTVLWSKESEETKNFFKKFNKRWIILPCSASAEMLSVVLFQLFDRLINLTDWKNNEDHPWMRSVKYFETKTGSATAFREDIETLGINIEDIKFSPELS